MATLSAAELAQSYGFAFSFLKSDASLWALFSAAVKGNWTADKFQAGLKNTTWWKKNADSVRQYKYLASTDPATLNARKTALAAQIRDTLGQLGGIASNNQVAQVATNALMFNWNDSQIRDVLSGYVQAVNGVYMGQAGTDVDAIKQTAWRNGIKLSDATVQSWARNMATGNGANASWYQDYIRQQAKSLAPGYAAQLDGGMDLYDIANPYIQAKAQILESDPQSIDLFDPDIRKALSATNDKGQPATQSLWQFELSMRQKPEWLQTKNAQDATSAAARKVLTDFGFQGV
jgi:hypothetical protein